VQGEAIRPGVTTQEIDAIVRRYIEKRGASPSFLGYHGYPASICASVNDQVVHGIPDDRVLKEGDIVSIDLGAKYKGYHGDTTKTFAVGAISAEAKRLIQVTEQSFYAGVDAFEAGKRLANFIHACSEELKIVTMLSGHRATVELSPEDLRALDLNTAAITGLKLVGYERPLPMWEALGGNGNGNGHKR
jgi:methionyl aminopeptidase